MKNHHKIISFLSLIFLFLSMPTFGQTEDNPALEKQLDEFFSEWDNPTKPGVAAGLIHKGKIVYLKGFGSADMENQMPITPATKFQIGALSKQFTAFAILLLEEEGRLSLQDDVRKYVPELPDFGTPITVKHLLSQSSGLHDFWALKNIAGWAADDVFTQQDALNLIYQQKQLDFAPGTDFSRTNSGLILLAEVVAKVTGQSFANYVKTAIFEPLQMNNSVICDDHNQIILNKAVSYQAVEEGHKKRAINQSVVGATNVYTSAVDLCRWYINFTHPKVGSRSLIKKMMSPVTLNDGVTTYRSNFGELLYGQDFEHAERGVPKSWTYGLAGGYASNVFRYLGEDLTSFVIGNNNNYNGAPAMKMTDPFMESQYKGPPSIDFKKLKTKKLSTKQLQQFDGYYWNEKGAYARQLYTKNDTLHYVRVGSDRENLLVSLSENSFQMVVGSDDVILLKMRQKDGRKQFIVTSGDSDEFVHDSYSPVSYTSHQLKEFTGIFYAESLNTTYTFSVKEDQLIASHLRKNDISFSPTKKDLFIGDQWYFGSIQYIRDSNQLITGFTVNVDGMKNLLFKKVSASF